MTEYYIDPENGSNANNGTSVDDAWADFGPVNTAFGSAQAALQPGDTVFVRGTATVTTTTLDLYRDGDTSGDQILITNYEDEQPVIDAGKAGSKIGIRLNGVKNMRIEHLEVKNATKHGIAVRDGGGWGTTQLELHNLESHHNGQGGVSGAGFHVWQDATSNVHITNCVSHQNQAGGNSSGFALGGGPSNLTVEDCLSYCDPDDGFDTNKSGGGFTFRRCITAYAGYDINGNDAGGNGNGFKLQQGEGGHHVERCVSYGCKRWGVKDYQCANGNEVYHHTVWDGNDHAYFSRGNSTEFVNCISHQNPSHTSFDGTQNDHHNSWNLGISDPQFQDTTLDERKCPKNENFLCPVQDSPVVEAGTDVGVSYTGDNPDIGAYEYRSQDSAGASLKYFDGSSWQTVRATAVYGNQDSGSASLKYFDSSSWQTVDTDVTFRAP